MPAFVELPVATYSCEDKPAAVISCPNFKIEDAISKRYKFIPAKVIVTEHHVGIYASKKDNRIVKADHPKALLKGSPVSASIAAAIMNEMQ